MATSLSDSEKMLVVEDERSFASLRMTKKQESGIMNQETR